MINFQEEEARRANKRFREEAQQEEEVSWTFIHSWENI